MNRIVWMVVAFVLVGCRQQPTSNQSPLSASVSNIASLVALPADSLNQLDIARMNLICAEGLPGAEEMDIADSLAIIDQMAARVRSETERHTYRLQKNPDEFENSSVSNPEDAMKPLG